MAANGAIAIGNYDFRSSGTVAKSIEIATAAVEAGLPAELWVMRASGPLRERVPLNVPVVEVGSGWKAKSRAADLALSVLSLGKALRQRRPSLFLSGGNHLHLPARFALGISGQRGRIRYGVRASNSSARPGRRAHHAEMLFWDRIKYQGTDFVVAVSRDLAEEVRCSLPAMDVEFIPNGVDIGRVRQLASEPFQHPFLAERQGNRPVIAAMGRICQQKGFDILIKALACLHPDVRARLLVIGDGKESDIDKLRGLAKEQNVAEDVDFIGYLPNPFAAMSKADLFVSASRWEGASNALNEALVCGLPIVATDCPTGNREALKDGEYGTLVPIENPPALAKGVLTELSIGKRKGVKEKVSVELDLRSRLNDWVKLLAYEQAVAGK
ncbi:glycosyltransferase [Rhizorhapis sp.]|uniref:glycosyltransferase n=1 Tax=Rhizorhapis sp. TaxID=1968842 RepID=UPI002B46294F|nr:glycosyltransferase [Rhizorhapis sp.]HKR17874.1 glycosyltransferase [Rhizorhapis sp.]